MEVFPKEKVVRDKPRYNKPRPKGYKKEVSKLGDLSKAKYVMPLEKNKAKSHPKVREVTITKRTVFDLALTMASRQDLALLLGVSESHLIQAYGDTISKAHAQTRVNLLNVIKFMALTQKNERVVIWLSKCWLGMHEPVAAEPSTVINISVADVPTIEATAQSKAEPAQLETR
jgi:hypothetical protein